MDVPLRHLSDFPKNKHLLRKKCPLTPSSIFHVFLFLQFPLLFFFISHHPFSHPPPLPTHTHKLRKKDKVECLTSIKFCLYTFYKYTLQKLFFNWKYKFNLLLQERRFLRLGIKFNKTGLQPVSRTCVFSTSTQRS